MDTVSPVYTMFAQVRVSETKVLTSMVFEKGPIFAFMLENSRERVGVSCVLDVRLPPR